jgi:hypothetical protein
MRFGQEIDSTRLHRLDSKRNFSVAGQHHDWHAYIHLRQRCLNL